MPEMPFDHMALSHEAYRTNSAFAFFAAMAAKAIPEQAAAWGHCVVVDDAQDRDEAGRQVELTTAKTLTDAYEVYYRQMVVVWAALLESAIEHYLMVVFSKHPERIEASLPPKNAASRSKDPACAAAAVRSFRHNKMKAALLEASGGHLAGFDFGQIDDLNTKRNEIVHEWSQEKIDRDQLTSYYGSVRTLIDALAEACRADAIVVRDLDYVAGHMDELST